MKQLLLARPILTWPGSFTHWFRRIDLCSDDQIEPWSLSSAESAPERPSWPFYSLNSFNNLIRALIKAHRKKRKKSRWKLLFVTVLIVAFTCTSCFQTAQWINRGVASRGSAVVKATDRNGTGGHGQMAKMIKWLLSRDNWPTSKLEEPHRNNESNSRNKAAKELSGKPSN